jgi:hypothetical protein
MYLKNKNKYWGFTGLTIIIIMLVFSSCMNEKTPEQKKTDALIQKLDSFKRVVDNVNIDSIKFYYEITKDRIEKVNAKLGNNLMEQSYIQIYADFSRASKSFKKYLQYSNDLNNEISFSVKQMNNFSSDLEKQVFTKEQFDMYFKSESDAINNMMDEYKFYLHDLEICLGLFHHSKKQIDNYIQ